MTLTREIEAAFVGEGRAILANALRVAGAMTDERTATTDDPHYVVERILLTAAAVLIARRAARTRATAESLVAEQQLFLEARVADARSRAMQGVRP